MPIRVVQLGTTRAPDEGLRLGTVRRVPRGVKKTEWARRDFFDLWLPELAPSEDLRKWALSEPITAPRWHTYRRKYLAQMKRPQAIRLIALLTALSHQTDFSVGCYCADESHCHRTLLKALLIEGGASVLPSATDAKESQ